MLIQSSPHALARSPSAHVDLPRVRRRQLDLIVAGCAASEHDQRLILRAGAGEIAIELARRGHHGLTHGDARLSAADRELGAAFVGEVSRWLGTPLAGTARATPMRPGVVLGKYARLGSQRDADGADWEIYELFVGDPVAVGDDAELFLRVGSGKAVMMEKAPRDREALVRLLSRTLGDARAPERRMTMLTPCRQARLSVPMSWRVSTLPTGQLRITDSSESCCFDAATLALPRDLTGRDKLAQRLRAALVARNLDVARMPIVTRDRGDLTLAWAEHAYVSEDLDRGGRRYARGRWLFAASEHLLTVITFQYWFDDRAWAIGEWERIVDTLELIGGRGAARS